jgi:hypothetical protein
MVFWLRGSAHKALRGRNLIASPENKALALRKAAEFQAKLSACFLIAKNPRGFGGLVPHVLKCGYSF